MCFFGPLLRLVLGLSRDRKKGVITKGVFSLKLTLETLKSLHFLETRGHGRILLCFPHFKRSLESRESLENGHFTKDPFSKDPFC